MTATDPNLDLLDQVIARARKAGADAADAVLYEGVSISHANGWARSKSWNGAKATISACAC